VSQPAPVIVGAGLAGLIASQAWPHLEVLEAAPAPLKLHRALLRFRSDAVARLTGIDFKQVRVHKGIWFKGAYVQPSIAVANMYAQKVTGELSGDRSIWNLAACDRFIAPPNFYERLVVAATPRITWGEQVNVAALGRPAISTAPLPSTLEACGFDPSALAFRRAPIRVRRYALLGADLYQTVYYPSPATSLYRASITGDLLIVESVTDPAYVDNEDANLLAVCESFGLQREPEKMTDTLQHFGKIVPLPREQRQQLLFELTLHHNVYSLGRFATWRNILLDDVVQDIAVVRRLMAGQPYQLRMQAS
jgi:hypothetical protein